MQVLPLLTPIHFMNNEKKRTRSDDDFESNCLKKRLISSCAPTTPPYEFYDIDNNNEQDNQVDHVRGRVTPPSSYKYAANIDDKILPKTQYCIRNKSILDDNFNNFMEINGKKLYNNDIPNFILNSFQDKETENQLVLYKSPSLLFLPPLSPPTTPTITEIDDEEEEEEEDSFEPMDLD